MTKRYVLLQSDCECSLVDFYENVAKKTEADITDATRYDCRKICITKSVQEGIWKHYTENGQSDEQIATLMLQYGPKANLTGEDFAVAIEDGFITESE